jgi:hypothetical protein
MSARINVRAPIEVLVIERGENDQRALRAHLKYRSDIDSGGVTVETCTGGRLEVSPDLEDVSFLEHFLALGTSAFDEICRLGPNTRQRPVRLETGVLAELLAKGLAPSEVLVFCLNHGAAVQPAGPPLSERQARIKQLRAVAKNCRKTAEQLKQVQRISIPLSPGPEMTESELGRSVTEKLASRGIKRNAPRKLVFAPTSPNASVSRQLPPLCRVATAGLIKGLVSSAERLDDVAQELRRAFKRPRDYAKSAFRRDWYHLTKDRIGKLLHRQGAKLYELVFQEVMSEASFRVTTLRDIRGKDWVG